MSVTVYGCNHIAIEVDDVDKAVAFYPASKSATSTMNRSCGCYRIRRCRKPASHSTKRRPRCYRETVATKS